MDVRDLARAERLDLADTLEGLGPEQWDTPSLCAGWTVRDVAAHIVSYDDVSPADLIRRFAGARLSPGRANRAAIDSLDALPTSALVARMRESPEPAGLSAQFGGRVGLTDTLIHHQDVRRPLGLERSVPADRLAPVLDFALTAPPIRGLWRVRGLRVRATDLDWARGSDGPEVHGPAEAVLMAMSGRAHALADLEGDGVATLRKRMPA